MDMKKSHLFLVVMCIWFILFSGYLSLHSQKTKTNSSQIIDEPYTQDASQIQVFESEWYTLTESQHSKELFSNLQDINLSSRYVQGLENIETQDITVGSYRVFVPEIETLEQAWQSCIECVYSSENFLDIQWADRAKYYTLYDEVIKISTIRWERWKRVYEVNLFDNEKDIRYSDEQRIKSVVTWIIND